MTTQEKINTLRELTTDSNLRIYKEYADSPTWDYTNSPPEKQNVRINLKMIQEIAQSLWEQGV